MKKYFQLLLISLGLLALLPACNSNPEMNKKDVNKWIKANMDFYYFWNDKIPKSPYYELTPDVFFESLLYKYNKTTAPDGDRFSWIESDFKKLQAKLSGVSSDEIGFDYITIQVSDKGVKPARYYLLVSYPKKGTDAYSKGLKRGDFVTKINDQDLTSDNLSSLLRGTGARALTIAGWVYDATEGKEVLKTTHTITVQMQPLYAENPIYLDTIYNINGKNVGYLVYNFFARDKGDGSHAYDKELMNTLQKFNNVNEMVLDLRYNSGGAVSTAIGLASALMKDRAPDKVFGIAQYNPQLHDALLKHYKNNSKYNVDYFIDKMMDTTAVVADVPKLQISKLYVLTGKHTASASELVINGLKPYLNDNLVLIGDTTYGKNVGSITIYDEDYLKTKNMWGMQPIVVKYFNSANESNYTAGFQPTFPINELAGFDLVDFGDTSDPLLNKALTEIVGGAMPVKPRKVNRVTPMRVAPKANIGKDDFRKQAYPLIDDTREKDMLRIMQER